MTGSPPSGDTLISLWQLAPMYALATQFVVVWHNWQQASADVDRVVRMVLPLPLPEELCVASASQLPRWTVEMTVVVVVVVAVYTF